MEANHRAVFRDGLLWRFLLGVLVVGALRGVLVVVAQPGELLVEGLDGGFLLAENLFDQVMPVGFERLLLGKEFFDVVFWHRSIIRQERGRMQGPESHRSPRPLRFRQKLASVYVFRPRLLEKRVPDRQTQQACAVIRTKKAMKNRRQEYNHNRMNLLRRSSNILQATVINGLPPNEAASLPFSFRFPASASPLIKVSLRFGYRLLSLPLKSF